MFRPPGWRERKPWQPHATPGAKPVERKRGRAGQRERRAFLQDEPFCRACLAEGRHVAADVVDHVIPLAWARYLIAAIAARLDERWNKQGLCDPCHDAKSLRERRDGPPGDLLLRARRMIGNE